MQGSCSLGSRATQTYVPTLALPLPGCVPLDKLLNLSESRFPLLRNGINTHLAVLELWTLANIIANICQVYIAYEFRHYVYILTGLIKSSQDLGKTALL